MNMAFSPQRLNVFGTPHSFYIFPHLVVAKSFYKTGRQNSHLGQHWSDETLILYCLEVMDITQ